MQSRIDEIRHANYNDHWQVSQRMIEALRAEPGVLPAALAIALDLMETRNFALSGMHDACIDQAETVLSRPVEARSRFRALQLATNCALHGERYETALQYLGGMLRLAPELDDPEPMSDALSMAARIHNEVGELAQGLEYARQALDLGRVSQDQRAICAGLHVLAFAQYRNGRLEDSLRSSEQGWEECQRNGDPVLIAASMTMMGRVLVGLERHEDAVGWLRRALALYATASFETGEAQARYLLGAALIETGAPEEGLELLQQVQPIADRIFALSTAEVAETTAHAQAVLGNWDAALAEVERLRGLLRDADSERPRRFAYLQAEFESQRGEQELRLAREQNRVLQLSEQAAAKRVRIHWIAGLSAAVIAVLLVVLLVSFRIDRRRFHRLSLHDGLAGVYNHRSFHQEVQAALRRLGSRNAPSVLIVADVDLFKKINDHYGHQGGDRVLMQLGELLREQFPPPCILGRIGGEEFGIFIPGQNRLQAHQRIHMLRSLVGKLDYQGRTIDYTISFGLVEARGNVWLESLRRRADDALDRAKRAGGNEVVDAADLESVGQR